MADIDWKSMPEAFVRGYLLGVGEVGAAVREFGKRLEALENENKVEASNG